MNPLVTFLLSLGSRIIDTKKPTGLTNAATASGLTGGTAGYIIMAQSEDPLIQAMGAICILISVGLTLFKEYENVE